VEPFELIRRDREIEGASIRELARRHGVHRRAVRQALAAALPPESSAATRPSGCAPRSSTRSSTRPDSPWRR